jgi:hypothetical protein
MTCGCGSRPASAGRPSLLGEWDIVVADDRLVEGLDTDGVPVYRHAASAIRLRQLPRSAVPRALTGPASQIAVCWSWSRSIRRTDAAEG